MNYISVDGIFQLRNMGSLQYVSIVDNSREEFARLEQKYIESGPLIHSQFWYGFEIGGGRHLVVNMRSLMLMTVSGNSMEAGAPVELVRLQRDNPSATQTWLVDRDIKSGHYTIQNEVSKLYLTVTDASYTRHATMQQQPLLKPGRDLESQLFMFETLIRFGPFTPEPTTAVADLRESSSHQINFSDLSHPDSRWLLIGQVQIPFPFVREALDVIPIPGPHYVLSRRSCWGLVASHTHKVRSTFPKSLTTTIGLITFNEEEIKAITGITMGLDGSFRLGRFHLDVYGKQMAAGLNVEVGPNCAGPIRMTMPVKMEIGSGHPPGSVESIWYRKDHYILKTASHKTVIEWVTRDIGRECIRHLQLPVMNCDGDDS